MGGGDPEPKEFMFQIKLNDMVGPVVILQALPDTIEAEADGLQTGDKLEIIVVEMTRSELEKLPAWEGW